MDLLKLSESIKKLGRPKHGFSLCIYGPPKTGKTRLAATVAKVPAINRVYMIDLENGHETLLTMLRLGIFTPEEAAKINIIRVQDTPERPLGQETVLKLLTIKKDQLVCDEHGKIDCREKACSGQGTVFNIANLGHDDIVIIDSGSALYASLLNWYRLANKKARGVKNDWDEYGPVGQDLGNVLTIIQACTTNFIVITHELVIDSKKILMKDGKPVPVTIEDRYPLIGSKNFSINAAKFFSHILYMHMGPGKHLGGSGTTYQYRTVTGSRGGWQIEKAPELSLANIFDQLYKQEPVEDGKLVDGTVVDVQADETTLDSDTSTDNGV